MQMTTQLAREEIKREEDFLQKEKDKVISFVRKGYQPGQICRELSLCLGDYQDFIKNDKVHAARVIAAQKEYEESKLEHIKHILGIKK